MTKEKQTLAILERHFEFENLAQIDRVIETFADEMIWEAPARNIYLTDHAAIVAQYRKIIGGMINPRMEILHRLLVGDEAFEDRIIYFTAGPDNVWQIAPQQSVKLRLLHYFKVAHGKIIHEIGYEIWHTV